MTRTTHYLSSNSLIHIHHLSLSQCIVCPPQNRKNDEASYEKMLKLRREFSRTVTILEMIKKREKSKRELLHLTLEVVEKRWAIRYTHTHTQRICFQTHSRLHYSMHKLQ